MTKKPVYLPFMRQAVSLGIILLLWTPFAAEAVPPPICLVPGTVPVTKETRAAATLTGLPPDQPCWDPKDALGGTGTGEAKVYLRSILCKPDADNYGGMGPDGTIQKLDAKFAICAANFLKASQEAGISLCLREGARTVAKQEEYVRRGVVACKKGAGCEHPRGVAIDVNVFSNVGGCAAYKALHENAPKFGVHFYLGCRDMVHFVPIKGGCSAGGTIPTPGVFVPPTKPGETGASLSLSEDRTISSEERVVPPDENLPRSFYDFPEYYTPPPPAGPLSSSQSNTTKTLTSGLSDLIRKLFGGSSNSANEAEDQAPQSCEPKFSCTGNTLYYNTSSCTRQVYEACQYGCGGSDSCADAPSQNTATTPTPQFQQSEYIAPSPSITFPTSDFVILSEDLTLETPSSTSIYASGTVALSQPIYASPPDTFTSGDLAHSPSGFVGPQQNGFLAQVLATMKNTLISVLNFLTPFGGNLPR